MKSSMMRLALSAAVMAALASCAPMGRPGLGPVSSGSSLTPAPIPAADPATEASFQQWVRNFRPRAVSSGISPATYEDRKSVV